MKTYIKTKPGKSSLRSPSSVWQAPKHTNVWRCIYEVKGDQRAVHVEPELPSRLCPVAGMWSSNLQVATGVKSRLFVYNLRTCSGVQVQILTLYKASLRARPDEVYYSSETPQSTAGRTQGARWSGTVMVWNVDRFLFSSDNVNSQENTSLPAKFCSASCWVHWSYFLGHGWWVVHKSTGDSTSATSLSRPLPYSDDSGKLCFCCSLSNMQEVQQNEDSYPWIPATVTAFIALGEPSKSWNSELLEPSKFHQFPESYQPWSSLQEETFRSEGKSDSTLGWRPVSAWKSMRCHNNVLFKLEI